MNLQMKIIELMWTGPLSFNDTAELNGNSDYGIYQIYGTHAIFGSNALLYIGQANDGVFSRRLSKHSKSDRFFWEASTLEIYVGRIGSDNKEPPDDIQWRNEINDAERFLIFTCTPPYNSQCIQSPGQKPQDPLLILNHGRRNRLPFSVTSLALTSNAGTPGWSTYGSSDR